MKCNFTGQEIMFAKIFKPNSEKIFVASVPFMLVVPVVAYVVFNFFFNLEASAAGNIFSAVAFFCYSFISLFAIPFEGLLSLLGMLEHGGGIFRNGMLGLDFAGMMAVQAFYAIVFYVIFSIKLFLKSGRKMKHVFGGRN
ncbi:MAG TPA: hypothetical protein DCX32_03960 [Candidatus Moranbacteria bacterium]|nr:hypothetical protein [Candidatus Moranbacteria bacterium]